MVTPEQLEAAWVALGQRCAATPVGSPDFQKVTRLIQVSKDDLRAALEAAEKAAWRPISEAPTLERVIVSGIQPKRGTCPAYRWYHEDETDENGAPFDHHNADLFRYLPTPPRNEGEE